MAARAAGRRLRPGATGHGAGCDAGRGRGDRAEKAESLQDVPISIQTVNMELLQDNHITNLEELSFYMPNVTVSKSGSDDNLFIRGIGSGQPRLRALCRHVRGRYLPGSRQTVALGVSGRGTCGGAQGPQGVLFGKSTIGGAINITTALPTDELSGYVDTVYEPDANEIDSRFAVSGPLSEDVRAGLAGRYYTMDGYLDNVYTGDNEPNTDDYSLRGVLVWDATDALAVTVRGDFNDSDEKGSNQQLYQLDANNPNNPIDGRPYTIEPVDFDDKADFVDGIGGENVESSDITNELFSITMNYHEGIYDFTSITGYSAYDAKIGADADNSALDTLVRHTDEDFDQFSQELRVLIQPGGDFEYLAGIYYDHTNLDVHDTFDALLLPGAVDGTVFNKFKQESDSLAAFGQVTWNITEAWRWNVGLRYSDDQRNTKDVTIAGIVLLPAFADDYTNGEHRSYDDVTWNTSVQYFLHDDLMFYGTLSTGYKDGGYDQFYLGSHRAVDPQEASLELTEETANSAELGMKSTLLDGAMTF
ncbi:MAG: TonB-dependent receptor [Haliea sp.]|nr:TonB-dependent receptor [Haliea sp.]